ADLPTCRPADLPTCRPADLPTCRPADLPIGQGSTSYDCLFVLRIHGARRHICLSAIRYPLSAIRYPLSAIRYPLSVFGL
ncbi:hypothetical protein, partial [Aeromonas allosaccharophila]|uniref:hypothetical protein n=1 Tax=Aeromonas allosaccharophila TaxID=656 RepID=UPI002B48176F